MAKRPGNPKSATGRTVAVAELAPAAGPAADAGRAARPRPGRTATTARSVNTTTSVTTRAEIQRARTGGASRRPKMTSAMAAAPMTAYGTSHGASRPAAPGRRPPPLAALAQRVVGPVGQQDGQGQVGHEDIAALQALVAEQRHA